MVLSNKKLKQKLRAELQTKSVTEPESKSNSDANSQAQSLKALLDSASQKPRLSKREKRRKAQPLLGLEGLSLKSDEIGSESANKSEKKKKLKKKSDEVEAKEDVEVKDGDGGIKKEKKKKRKREEGVEDGEVKEAKTPKKSKKKKKKKKGKKKKEVAAAVEEKVVEEVKEMDVAAPESQVIEDVARKVYVGGIPYSYTEDDIWHYFEGCGTITEVDCMKFPDTGKFRGIAFISFETEEAAKRALALDRAEMAGFQLTIQPYKSSKTTQAPKDPNFAPKMVEGYNRIYVGNLSWDITEDDLKKFFSDCTISSIRFGTDKETGEFRGYAHIDFTDSVSLAMALKLDQEIVCGRPVKISCAVPEIKTGKKQPKTLNTKTLDPKPKPVVIEEVSVVEGVSSGKMRRRTCYECGEKGHLSSACPKKKDADATKSNDA